MNRFRFSIVLRCCAAGLAVAWIAILAAGEGLWAQEALPPLLPVRALEPPLLDGVLDDPVWKSAPTESGFKTYSPDYGQELAERTVVYYAYDRENLYFAFRCFDREPARIKASVTSRDNIRSEDWVCINLDSYGDQQSLYVFYVNPLGIQSDSTFAANKEDFGVDLVWYSAGRIDSEGYAVEIRIPFKSIRYSRREPVRMAVIFERRISRRTENGTYPALDPRKGMNFLTQGRPLLYEDVRHYSLVELLPGVTYSRRSDANEGRLRLQGQDTEFSLTGKYGLTSRLVLDGAVNPDFSQVEADAGQVDFNQRFALYYPEKRPFFLEGLENFNFGGYAEGDPLQALVHTRQIVNPLAGVKLTGRAQGPNTLSALYALDEPLDGASEESSAHFSILRFKRAMSQDSYWGTFYTGRESGDRFNRVVGGDGFLRLSDSSSFGAFAFGSFTGDDSQPTDTRTGHAIGADYSYNTRDRTFSLGAQDLDEDFATESGYVTRTGITRFRAAVTPKFYPRSQVWRRIDLTAESIQIRDKPSGLFETNNSGTVLFILPRNTLLSSGYAYGTEVFLGERFDSGGLSLRAQSLLSKRLTVSARYSRGRKIRYVNEPFQGKGQDAAVSATWLPTDNLTLGLSWTYSDLYRTSDSSKVFDYSIIRSRNTYQVNRYLFLRAIVEYNSFRRRLTTDFLASFTYIPGTVVHCGYGSLYEKLQWYGGRSVSGPDFSETGRSLFCKASYLWRY